MSASKARDEFLLRLEALKDAASGLSSPRDNNDNTHPSYLQLNGLHVILFSALETFIKSRVLEVFRLLPRVSPKFQDLPVELQSYILHEWVKGIGAYIQKKEDSTRLQHLLDETRTVGTIVSDTFEVSSYSFGAAQSNLGKDSVRSILSALGITNPEYSLRLIAASVGHSHLGDPSSIFERLMQNRHLAAHTFSLDFKLPEFRTDLEAGARLLAFVIDTCLSQSVLALRKCFERNHVFHDIDTSTFKLKKIEFSNTKKAWEISILTPTFSTTDKKSINKLSVDYEQGKGLDDFTILIVGSNGITTWYQPIDDFSLTCA